MLSGRTLGCSDLPESVNDLQSSDFVFDLSGGDVTRGGDRCLLKARQEA